MSGVLPAVLSVKSAANQPRFMDYDLKTQAFEHTPIIVWGPKELATEPARVGLKGSPTRVMGLREAEVRDRRREQLKGSIEDVTLELVEILDPYLRA